MTRLIGLLNLCVLVATISFAQTDLIGQETIQVDDSTPIPVMTFESAEIDYGVIPHNGEPYREFHFINTGDAPLVIKNAKGSCGCTVPEWSKEPVAPGESSIVKVRYATNRIGKFSKTITLTTNDAEGTHVLRIKGEVLKGDAGESVPAAPATIMNKTTQKGN
jgi:hypothetical protein